MKMYEIINRVRSNDPITLMMLEEISSKDVNEEDYQTGTNILHSGLINDVYILNNLINKGLNIKSLNSEKQNALFTQESPEIIKLLIEKKLSVNKKDKNGNTPLMSSPDNLDKIKILIESGADINEKNNFDSTVAFYVKSKDVLIYLIENGLDLSVKNKYGETPIFNRDVFTNPELLKCFLDNGVNINEISCYHSKNTVMKNITATNDRSVNTLKSLKIAKSAGLDLYKEDAYGQTLLRIVESSTQLRTLFSEGELNLNLLKKNGETLFEDMAFQYLAKDLYLSGHLNMEELFNAPEERSVGDFLIKNFEGSSPDESKKLKSLKEKIIINSNLNQSIADVDLESHNKKRL